MSDFDLEELRARVNPQYANTKGTESYERRQCVEEIASLKQQLAEAKKDAERYRWLRSKDTGPSQIWELLSEDCQPPHMTLKTEAELDAAIDQAMREGE